MKLFKITFLLVVLFIASADAFAATWTGKLTLHRVYTAANTVYVQTSPSSAHINPDGCKAASNYAMDPEATLFNERYQLLLTGLVSEKTVSLELSGCLGSYPKVTKVILYK